jgi:hypothetical protein
VSEADAAWLAGLLAALGCVDLRPGALHREVAVIAAHFHWPRDELMGMSRRERREWLGEIDRINRELAKALPVPRRASRRGRQG